MAITPRSHRDRIAITWQSYLGLHLDHISTIYRTYLGCISAVSRQEKVIARLLRELRITKLALCSREIKRDAMTAARAEVQEKAAEATRHVDALQLSVTRLVEALSQVRAGGGVAAMAEARLGPEAAERLTWSNLDNLAANLNGEICGARAAVEALSEAVRKGAVAAEGGLAS